MDLPKLLRINKWLFLSFIEWKADKQKDTDAFQSQRERALPAPNFLSNPVISCLIGFWHGFVHKNSTVIQLTEKYFFLLKMYLDPPMKVVLISINRCLTTTRLECAK